MPRPTHPKTGNIDRRPVALLTGFGPFPGVAENVTGRLVAEVARQARLLFPGYRFETDVLPTEWQTAPQRLVALLQDLKPELALLFGVAKDARGFRIETEAANSCWASPDAAGLTPLAPVLVHGAVAAYSTTLPTDSIVRRLKSLGVPVSISNDAGGYLCNAALYHALHAIESAGHPCRAGFIHIPDDLSKPPLTLKDAIAGALEIIGVSLLNVNADLAQKANPKC